MSAEQLLGSVVTDQMVIADLEAGIGTLTRLADEVIDVVVVVVEPTPRSLEVGARARDLATQRAVGRLVVVANRVHDEQDRQRIAEVFGSDVEVIVIPHDPAIVAAERQGVSPIESAPDSPAVIAVTALADLLVRAA